MARIKKWVILRAFIVTAWLYNQLVIPNNAEAAKICCECGVQDGQCKPYCS